MTDDPEQKFDGAKLALIAGDRVLTMLRDDRPDIPFPNMWDLPGGGREGGETPEDCVLRETGEEFGLHLTPDMLVYRVSSRGGRKGQTRIWFFGTVIDDFDPGLIRFGDEGQGWEMMPVRQFASHPQAVGHLKSQLQTYLDYLENPESGNAPAPRE